MASHEVDKTDSKYTEPSAIQLTTEFIFNLLMLRVRSFFLLIIFYKGNSVALYIREGFELRKHHIR